MIDEIFERKQKSSKKFKKFRGEENYKRMSGSKFECATSIGAPTRKLIIYNL
jgi:hypothetical protein